MDRQHDDEPERADVKAGRRSSLVSRLIALTLFALVLFTPPMLGLFDKPLWGEISALPLYLFAAWMLVIVLCALLHEGKTDE